MRLTIGRKLGLAFGTILFLMLVSAVATHFRANEIERTQEAMAQIRVPTVKTLSDLQRDLNQAQSKGRQVILAGTQPTRRDEAQKVFESNWKDIDKDVVELGDLAPHWSLQENRDRFSRAKELLPNLRQVQEVAMHLAASGEKNAVIRGGDEFADKATAINEDIKKSLGEMADSNEQLLNKNSEEISSANSSLL
jgi:methyl-accepting chemotaxis protein